MSPRTLRDPGKTISAPRLDKTHRTQQADRESVLVVEDSSPSAGPGPRALSHAGFHTASHVGFHSAQSSLPNSHRGVAVNRVVPRRGADWPRRPVDRQCRHSGLGRSSSGLVSTPPRTLAPRTAGSLILIPERHARCCQASFRGGATEHERLTESVWDRRIQTRPPDSRRPVYLRHHERQRGSAGRPQCASCCIIRHRLPPIHASKRRLCRLTLVDSRQDPARLAVAA